MIENSSLKILSELNTKTRRLGGYLIFLVDFLKRGHAPEILIIQKLQQWAKVHQASLETHVDSTGVITATPQSTSARRYLHLASGIHLIAEVSGQWRLSKFGKVLAPFSQNTRIHPFELSRAEGCFFLRQLLLHDADYLLPIWEIIHETPRGSLKEIEAQFQTKILGRMKAIQRAEVKTDFKHQAQSPAG